MFPGGASGVFSALDLTPRGHYEVHGEDMESMPAAGSSGQRFAFMRASAVAAAAASHSQRATSSPPVTSKTFQRSVYLAEVVGGRLIPNRMVVVRFLECEATLQGVVGKVQDAIGNYNPIILTDAQGNAILESEGTTGSQYWKQNARKVLALPEQDFNSLQGTKRRRLSNRKDDDSAGLGEVSDKIEELVMASQSLPAVTAAIRELTDLAVTQRVILTAPKLQTIKEGFSCVVCMNIIEEPVLSRCCRSIIGCKTCVEQWLETSPHCAKCREANNGVIEVTGLTAAFSVLKSFFTDQ
ncbi:uncharacterized protein LOC114651192 isoform X1 [Erpetoichthys calabaricus]|uniref:uncharacterized protein LOC114651192 isoform X1 n=1 Tax=Erpetoichthys calabaricus TaxID=27687 RepID=UPI002233F901|nr:uncharacterized protein LOC114651192 isoform X1 [Erpetoichthys calabaricus]